MTDINRPKSYAWIYTWAIVPAWAIVLGLVGFICGYSGQLLLLKNGDSLGPLLGYLTGPIGFFLGALLGALSTWYRMSIGQNLLYLAIAAVAGSVGTLYLTVAEYKPIIQLVDAEIVGCEKIDKLLASQAKHWSEGDAANPRPRARPNWEQNIRDMVLAEPGTVLTMRIYRQAEVREQRWSWGDVSQRVDDWKSINETIQVFAAIAGPVSHSPCESFTIGERRFSSVIWEKTTSKDFLPTEKISRFLWLPVLQQVPPEYVRYLPKSK